jgi:HK97 family phage major capsid protein
MKILKLRIKYFLLEMLAIAARPLGRMFYTKLAAFDADPAEVLKTLNQISADVKAEGAKAIEMAKKAGDMSAEQKEKIDGMLLKQGELQEALREVQQKQARAGEVDQGTKSMGQQAIESDTIKSFASSGQRLRKGQSLEIATKATITSGTAAGAGNVGLAIAPDRRTEILRIPDRRFTIRDLVAPGQTSAPVIIYPKETGYTNNAAPVAEGTRKPQSDISMTIVTETVKKLATFMKASTEILSDLPALRSFIDYRLRYMLRFREEAQLLMGSGVGNNLNGIYTQATAYAAPTGATAPTTPIDKLRLALLQAELAEFPSDGLVLHPTDWANIELQKDTQGRYLIGNPQGTIAPTLWNRPVVATQAMTVGQFLAGAFQLGAQIFDREDAAVVIATENEDDFVQNLVTILIEERLALAVYRPEAFVKGALAVA